MSSEGNLKVRGIICTVVAVLMLASVFGGCERGRDDGKLRVVCTVFPQYDWIRNIAGDAVGDRIELELIVKNGADVHSYQASVADIAAVSSCDMLVCVGGESEAWVSRALEQSDNADMTVVKLLEVLGNAAKEEETVEGMETEDGHDEHGNGHDDADAHDHEDGEAEYDEHVWLSLKNASLFCRELTDKLCALDADNAEKYRANGESYTEKINSLDARFEEAVGTAERDVMVVADRFPFRYLADDYGLGYYAAFPGCSAETEASFKTVDFLAERVRSLELDTVLVTDGANKKIAEAVIAASGRNGCVIRSLDSMQSVRTDDIDAGKTYLGAMESNLGVLGLALN